MEQSTFNLGTVKGKSFAELRSMFIAKPLALGEHTVVIEECDFSKATINPTTKQEILPLTVRVDGETFTRSQYFTVNGMELLARNAGRQIPAIAGRPLDEVLSALVANKYTLSMWIVSKTTDDGQTYHNWLFFKPAEPKETTETATANDMA